ncbi:MAG: strawberry notch C-terminal domain-containing protein, partial [Ruminiclostridium sp.]
LMRALNGVMRYTENDADKNSEGGIIPLSYIGADGQRAYNEIKAKIEALSADLPISPMDAIRAKIEDAGYTIAEITGRKLQLNKTANGKYIVEDRKDKDANKSMRDFNSGRLDVLMINKSGSTGISLHASSKFEDQRQRVMVFAQFQSDINDEVQMRGRIDRSGQVARGRYEYIMSTIPAEQRLQMMFKAKLKSLDANTTSSQKSKFNEMEIVDYLNKYGDEVVWEYMKEHPELEERLGDPLEMLKGDNEEKGKRSKKEDKSKKEDCAAKISRYLAFLSVEEQDEIFREITEAYKVKMQLLDDAGENDLEITTMPLRAETKNVKLWHKGTAPNSGNAFADNTYVEEVECDVLKKPMKRSEIDATMRKLMGELYAEKNGGMDWNSYIRRKNDEVAQYFTAKADDAIAKLAEQGEARIAKAREKAVKDGEKARGRGENNFTDEQIQTLADTMAAEARANEEQKQQRRREEIWAVRQRIGALMQRLVAGSIYVVPQDLKNSTADMFTQTYGTFVGFKFNKNYTLGSSTAVFATLDGRRKVELALNDRAIDTIIQSTDIARRYSPKDIGAISLDNWDSKVPTQTRQKRYIITGNLLQALVDTEKGNGTRGNLISYSTIDGETRQGILMGENFKPSDLRSSATLSSRLAQIKDGKAVVSEDGDVKISKILLGWEHKGDYELRVPKSKQRGGKYTMNDELLSLVWKNNFVTKGGGMVAYVSPENIARVVDLLSREPFNLTVLEESKLEDTEGNTVEEKTEKYSAKQKWLFGDAKQNPVQLSMFDTREDDGGQTSEAEQKANDAIEAFADVYSRYADEEDDIITGDSENTNNSVEVELIQAQNDLKAALTDFYKQSGNSEEDAARMANDMLAQVRSEVEVSRIFLENAKTRGIQKFEQEKIAKEEQQKTEQQKKQKNTCETAGGEVISVESSGGLPKLKRGEFAVVERQFAIDKNFTFDGKAKIESVDDVAYIFRQLESYCVEHAFAMLVKDGKPTIVHLGMGTFSATQVNTGALRAAVDKFGADSIYFIHNHPSGALKPSFQDQNLFNELQNMFKGKKVSVDAIIIDTTSGKYVQFSSDTTVEGNMPKNVDGAVEYPVHSFSKQVFNDVEVPQKVIRSSSDVAEVLSTLRLGKRNKLGFLLLNRAHQVVGNIFSNYGSYNKAKDIADEIVKYALHYGADSVVTYGNIGLDGVDKVKSEVSRLSNRSVTLLDGINVANGLSAVDSGVMENGMPYEKGWINNGKATRIDKEKALRFIEALPTHPGTTITSAELDDATKVVKEFENPSIDGVKNEQLRDGEDIEAINERFNEELQQQIDGILPKGHIYQLGKPGELLKACGFPDMPIELSSTNLLDHSKKERHRFDIVDIKGLVKELQNPIAVFAYGNKSKSQNVIVEIQKDGKNFLVGVHFNQAKNGIEVSSIRGIFPKDNSEW